MNTRCQVSPPGSSPLARGALPGGHADRGACRLIPARAGSTSAWRSRCRPQWAHPRSRGEHVVGVLPAVTGLGSSPLARGAHLGGAGGDGDRGLIPARAGSTSSVSPVTTLSGAHPRSRGEHTVQAGTRTGRVGSSPLARGARGPLGLSGLPKRLIPARAGSTREATGGPCGRRAHPRSRGEHSVKHAIEFVVQWLIPARAGSTRRPVRGRACSRAHPRSRGEHIRTLRGVRDFRGSSPLARGAHRREAGGGEHVGLIPARAGSTEHGTSRQRPQPGSSPLARGAPRWCSRHTRTAGSSPLARGALPGPSLLGPGERLIPARAGSTPHVPVTSSTHAGSSPLARGARAGCVRPVVDTGLIPARAGSTD